MPRVSREAEIQLFMRQNSTNQARSGCWKQPWGLARFPRHSPPARTGSLGAELVAAVGTQSIILVAMPAPGSAAAAAEPGERNPASSSPQRKKGQR